jgi:hypothetical protein
MSEDGHFEMHADHRLWRSEEALWLDEVGHWHKDITEADRPAPSRGGNSPARGGAEKARQYGRCAELGGSRVCRIGTHNLPPEGRSGWLFRVLECP